MRGPVSLQRAFSKIRFRVQRSRRAIATTYGRPFSVKGFGQFVADAIRKAGLLPHCKAHGLRKAAARRLAEAACSAHEIAAVLGHKALSEIERYTRAASQETLNASAIEKLTAGRY